MKEGGDGGGKGFPPRPLPSILSRVRAAGRTSQTCPPQGLSSLCSWVTSVTGRTFALIREAWIPLHVSHSCHLHRPGPGSGPNTALPTAHDISHVESSSINSTADSAPGQQITHRPTPHPPPERAAPSPPAPGAPSRPPPAAASAAAAACGKSSAAAAARAGRRSRASFESPFRYSCQRPESATQASAAVTAVRAAAAAAAATAHRREKDRGRWARDGASACSACSESFSWTWP
jgi:hypothetical protein